MNTDTIAGKFDQLKGEAKQSIGEATNNDRLANSGTFDQVKGAAKEAWGSTKDAAHDVAADAKVRTDETRLHDRAAGEDTAHSIRETVASAAQSVKNFVTGHDDVNHNR